MRWVCLFASLAVLSVASSFGAEVGAEVHYRLPRDGPLPATYRVTLAVTHAEDPHHLSGLTVVLQFIPNTQQGEFWDKL
jgi:predicted ATP-grasp superfamily ATP-dependent carboligase